MEAELNSFKPILKIGDPIHFSFKLPQHFRDTLNQVVDVDRGVQVVVKLSIASNLSETSTGDTFATDTTIFHVLDQYFETKNIAGKSINAYTFACVLRNGFWEIETEYITKKAGNYWASISFNKIDSSVADTRCMTGDEFFGATLVWKPSENNRIDVLFNDNKAKYPEYYGFIVNE